MAAERDQEQLPLLSKVGASGALRGPCSRLLLPAFWGGTILAASSGMINLNKHLMQDTVFPFVIPMVMLQFVFAMLLNGILMLMCPGLFVSLSAKSTDEKKVHISLELIFWRVFPVALALVISLVFSNLAYYYSSVPFLQMMKEANIITVYVFSLILGMENFSPVQAGILALLAMATLTSIDGELHFSLVGMLVQGIACIADATKNIISGMLLSGAGRKLDPMSFGFLLSPLVLLLCSLMLVSDKVLHDSSLIEIPPWERFYANRSLLLLNAVAAFVLNLSITMFLRHSTALSFAVLGVVKDFMVVASSTMIMGAPVSLQQKFSFSAQIILVLTWTYMKLQHSGKT